MSTMEVIKFTAMLFIVGFILNAFKGWARDTGRDKLAAGLETVTP